MTSFPPILGSQPTILILGSMPSQMSLAKRRYYANPSNAFWWLMSQIIGFSIDLSYAERCQHLEQAGFAVWDVLHDCERKGSLDSNIVRESEQANDIASLIKNNPSLTKIGFNGRAAQAIFGRHIKLDDLSLDIQQHLLPSTSSAHARMKKQQKLQAWCLALDIKAVDENSLSVK